MAWTRADAVRPRPQARSTIPRSPRFAIDAHEAVNDNTSQLTRHVSDRPHPPWGAPWTTADDRRFDDFLRDLSGSRRSLLSTGLAVASAVAGFPAADAKDKKSSNKKKKKCAQKCEKGCCTGKHGKCIKPAQQGPTQCGTGGEICRTDCEWPPTCSGSCDFCCDGNTCVTQYSDAQCGADGVRCFACDDDQECSGSDCCGKLGRTCEADKNCCVGLLCDASECCRATGLSCDSTNDCCQLGTIVICDSSVCVVEQLQSCEPGWMCQGGYLCPGSGVCDHDSPCTGETYECFGDALCCTPETVAACDTAGDLCECLVEVGCVHLHH